MERRFEINTVTGELKVFTKDGYLSILPNNEGVDIALYDKRIAYGYISEETDIPFVELAAIEVENDKFTTYVWDDTSLDMSTRSIEHEIDFKI